MLAMCKSLQCVKACNVEDVCTSEYVGDENLPYNEGFQELYTNSRRPRLS